MAVWIPPATIVVFLLESTHRVVYYLCLTYIVYCISLISGSKGNGFSTNSCTWKRIPVTEVLQHYEEVTAEKSASNICWALRYLHCCSCWESGTSNTSPWSEGLYLLPTVTFIYLYHLVFIYILYVFFRWQTRELGPNSFMNIPQQQQIRGGINNKKFLLFESFHEEGDPQPHDLVEKTQLIFFGLRTTNGWLLWKKSFFPLEKLKIP